MTGDHRQFAIALLKLRAYDLPALPVIWNLLCMILIVVTVMVHVTLAGFLEIIVPILMNTASNLQDVAVISRFVMMVQALRCHLVTLRGE